jgi:hypothetical protein
MTYSLDSRKPYVLLIKEKGAKEPFGGNPNTLPMIAIKAKLDTVDGEKCLFYYDIGCQRGHLLPGKVKKHLPNGIVFRMNNSPYWEFTMKELSMEEFEQRVRPTLNPITSEMLHDLDDVYTWYRQMVEMT